MRDERGRPDASRVRVPSEPLIGRECSDCSECWGCVRHCPARALRVSDGATTVIEERCVKCGLCVTECGNASHIVRDDTPLVRELLAGDRPVVALLASEYVAALHPMSTDEIEHSLERCGFAGVETTVLGEELVAAAYEQVHLKSETMLPRLRSTCPVTVEWVRRFYPQLVGALVPIVPPYVAQARLVRSTYPTDLALVYVSPCWARKDEAFEPEFLGDVDAVIGFDELKRIIGDPTPALVDTIAPRRARIAKQLSVTDGFPRATLSTKDLTNRDVVLVRGLGGLDRLLSAIVRGETAPDVIDMLFCEGCIDGPCVSPELSVFAKRAIAASEREHQRPAEIDNRSLLSALPSIGIKRAFEARPAPVREPTDAEIDAVLTAGEFASREETLDCGACGYNTCVEHAAAICLGNSSWDMCFPLQRKLLGRERARLEEMAVVDELTGLLNRRALSQRLAEEVARAQRYGTELSLVMVDLDGFKDVNDRHGHAAGDALLRSVGVLIRSELRVSDAAIRYGGDEFALLLPGTGKTDAWAVAEKVRTSLASLVVPTEDGELRTAASLGVASLGESHADEQALLEAADAALYRAKRGGRDRVELSAG